MNFAGIALRMAGLVFAATVVFAEGGPRKSGVRINLDELSSKPAESAPSSPAGVSTPTTRPAAQAVPGAAVTAPSAAPAAAAAVAPKSELKIDGLEVSRGERGFLGVKLEKGTFKVAFYGADRKAKPADVSRIALRWPVRYQPNDERTVLLPTPDGMAMTSERIVRPPHTFRLYMTLLKDVAPGDDPEAETYVIDFSQEAAEAAAAGSTE